MTPVAETLQARLADIPSDPGLRLLPVRHHSPACALHLEALIRRDRPDTVLIEGPADATPLLPYLGEKDARPPLALYCYYVADTSAAPDLSMVPGESRYRCFYPLAAFSPEWVAIRAGLRQGARVCFIDLPYGERLRWQDREQDRGGAETSLLSDTKLSRADPTARMIEASGCRDFDEWWDRYFEAGAMELAPESYFANLLSWCLLLRDTRQADPESEQRERYMAAQIHAHRQSGERCLVVTGGFHTEAIAHYLQQTPEIPPTTTTGDERGLYLVPYTLSRLDAANHYSAGLPNAGYYQEVWQQHRQTGERPHEGAARAIALRIAHQLRTRGEPISLPDCIEAVALSRRLAALRNTPAGRMEILDAMETAFTKDTQSPGEQTFAARIACYLSGELTGTVPKRYPSAPLVDDFRAHCRRFKLPLTPRPEREKSLDIYRLERHRQISRLLHQLRFLEIPYGEFSAGPDFAAATGLQRVREIWRLRWQPETEAALTERMVYGGRLQEAALNRLLEHLGKAGDAHAAASLLLAALSMGLHGVLEQTLAQTAHWLRREGLFPVLVAGLVKLHLAYHARHVLAAGRLTGLANVLGVGFERACLRLAWLGEMDEEAAQPCVDALGELDGLARADRAWCDLRLFRRGLEELYAAPAPARLRGRAAGILAARGFWDTARCQEALRQALYQATLTPAYLGDFLLGFLPVARSFLLQTPALVTAINERILDWDEATFLDVLPNLRLAFTALKPREAAALAELIDTLAGGARPEETSEYAAPDADPRALAWLHGQTHEVLVSWCFDTAENQHG